VQTYRLLAGRHSEGDKVYKAGDVFQSSCELLKHNNGGRKFELVTPVELTVKGDEQKSDDKSDVSAELATMSIEQLKSYAAELSIDLGSSTKKQEMIQIINKAVR